MGNLRVRVRFSAGLLEVGLLSQFDTVCCRYQSPKISANPTGGHVYKSERAQLTRQG
jgi:hypothetical protein